MPRREAELPMGTNLCSIVYQMMSRSCAKHLPSATMLPGPAINVQIHVKINTEMCTLYKLEFDANNPEFVYLAVWTKKPNMSKYVKFGTAPAKFGFIGSWSHGEHWYVWYRHIMQWWSYLVDLYYNMRVFIHHDIIWRTLTNAAIQRNKQIHCFTYIYIDRQQTGLRPTALTPGHQQRWEKKSCTHVYIHTHTDTVFFILPYPHTGSDVIVTCTRYSWHRVRYCKVHTTLPWRHRSGHSSLDEEANRDWMTKQIYQGDSPDILAKSTSCTHFPMFQCQHTKNYAVTHLESNTKVCQILSWRTKNRPHFIIF